MPKFKVYTKQRVIQHSVYTVEAETAEEAKSKVIDGTESGEVVLTDHTADEIVTMVKEVK